MTQKNDGSMSFSIVSFAAMLKSAEDFWRDKGAEWQAQNHLQAWALDIYRQVKPMLHLLGEDIKSVAGPADHVNEVLRKWGCSIQVNGDSAAAAQLDIGVAWAQMGEREKLRAADSKIYPGVEYALTGREGEPHIFSLFDGGKEVGKMVEMLTQTEGRRIYMVEAERPIDEIALYEKVQKIRGMERGVKKEFKLSFPMIDLQASKPDFSWAKGMHSSRIPAFVDVKQENAYRQNEVGAHGISTTVGGAESIGARITKPCICWGEDDRLKGIPWLVMYFDYPVWKRPKKL